MKTIGRHLLAEFYGCDERVLGDIEKIRNHMLTAAGTIGAVVMGETFHRFTPRGVSGAVVISESHLAIHTWPESGYVAIDIYTCGGLDPNPAVRELANSFGTKRYRVQEILRGLPEDLAPQRAYLPKDAIPITRMTSVRETKSVSPKDT